MGIPPDRQRQLELEAEAEWELEQEDAQLMGGGTGASSGWGDEPPATTGEVIGGGLSSILNGLTFNQGDEIIGGVSGGIDWLTGAADSFSEGFRSRHNESEDLRRKFAEESPAAGAFTEIGGSLIAPIPFMRQGGNAAVREAATGLRTGPRFTERLARATLGGATIGGITGLGDESGEGRLANAESGAGWGGLFGAGLETLISPIANWSGNAGGRLQRGSMGIRQSDVEKASRQVPRGAPNPLIESFESLRNEGVFSGSKAPADVQQRLMERGEGLQDELTNVLGNANAVAGTSRPAYPSSVAFIRNLRGTDRHSAEDIFQEEVQALIATLDNGGTVQDWQDAKRSLQGRNRYGSAAEDMRNEVRRNIASDFRQHIEDTVDRVSPQDAGRVRGINRQIGAGEKVNEVIQRGRDAELKADPEARFKQLLRTSGGYGVPIILAGGSEYGRSGDIKKSLIAGAAGAFAGSRTGKYAIGSAMRIAPVIPSIIQKAGTPVLVKQIAASKREPETALEYFRGGAEGVRRYRNEVGGTRFELDKIYTDATDAFRKFAAPSGTVDKGRAEKWIKHNGAALDALPELRKQLVNPASAQALIRRHFSTAPKLTKAETELNALEEFSQSDPASLALGLLYSPKAVLDMRRTRAFLNSEPDAVAGLRRAMVSALDSNPEVYAKNRKALEEGGVFTQSQTKLLEGLYSPTLNKELGKSTFKAIADMATGSFLSSGKYGKYAERLEEKIRQLPPTQVHKRFQEALFNPSLARDLVTPASGANVLRSMETLFGDLNGPKPAGPEFVNQAPTPLGPRPSLTPPRPDRKISGSSFPKPGDLQNQIKGELTKPTAAPESFNTALSDTEQQEFQQWVAQTSQMQGRDVSADMEDYDLAGFWKQNKAFQWAPGSHLPDTWKKPNHPTFSNESKYAGSGRQGGSWDAGGNFTPPGDLSRADLARIQVESSGNPDAVSPKGARGLMQLMPETAEEIAGELGEDYMPIVPGMTAEEREASIDQNIRFGRYYHQKLMKRYNGNQALADAAYNAGMGRVDEAIRRAGGTRDVNRILANLPSGVQSETIPYVQRIQHRLST